MLHSSMTAPKKSINANKRSIECEPRCANTNTALGLTALYIPLYVWNTVYRNTRKQQKTKITLHDQSTSFIVDEL
jgi:hypothetical protein